MDTIKKVLQISTSPLQYDGLTEVIFSLIDNVPTGLTEQFVLLGAGAKPEFINKLKERNVKYFVAPHRVNSAKQYYSYLFKVFKENNFDIVHVHGNSSTMALDLFIAKLCGIKTRIAHCHNTRSYHPTANKMLKPILNAVTTDPVACGNDAGRFLFYKKFTVIPNCINVNQFRFNEETRHRVRKDLGIDSQYLIGHVGRFSKQKNHHFIIDVFNSLLKKYPNSKLLLVGEGEDFEKTQLYANELGISDNIIFYGASNKVYELLQAMDIFLFPSIFEGLGITAIEAQCAGLPVVASNQVPEETKKTDNFVRLSLEAPANKWVEALMCYKDKEINRNDGADAIIEAGYDINKLSDVIRKVWKL